MPGGISLVIVGFVPYGCNGSIGLRSQEHTRPLQLSSFSNELFGGHADKMTGSS